MKILIVEDDFAARHLLQEILQPIGNTENAINGLEAIKAFEKAFDSGDKFDAIFLDIMLPEIDGIDVLIHIREYEARHGIHGLSVAKVIMTTALNDMEHIKKAFTEQCEAYLVKPITKTDVIKKLSELQLLD